MTRQRSMMICLFAAVALGFGLLGMGVNRIEAQQAKKAEKTAVAVVNAADLIAKCKKNTEFQATMDKRRAELQADQAKQQQKIADMKKDLDTTPPGPARSVAERKIMQAEGDLQVWQQVENQMLLREQRSFLIELYKQIDDTVEAVALREGYDIVLFDSPAPAYDKMNPEQLVQVIGSRRVVYKSPRVDLTGMVLEQMNLDHLSRGNN